LSGDTATGSTRTSIQLTFWPKLEHLRILSLEHKPFNTEDMHVGATVTKQQLIEQIEDAMRVAGNVHASATNFINSKQVIDGNGQIVTLTQINETLDRSTQIVQDAFRAAKKAIESMPNEEGF
jgi:hypothetical protein